MLKTSEQSSLSLSSGMYFLIRITPLTAEGSLIEVRTSMMKDRT